MIGGARLLPRGEAVKERDNVEGGGQLVSLGLRRAFAVTIT